MYLGSSTSSVYFLVITKDLEGSCFKVDVGGTRGCSKRQGAQGLIGLFEDGRFWTLLFGFELHVATDVGCSVKPFDTWSEAAEGVLECMWNPQSRCRIESRS